MIPANYGQDATASYLRNHLDNYVDDREFINWFELNNNPLTLQKVDEIFDLTTSEVFTIGMVANPYIRVWLNYVMNMNINEIDVLATPEDFKNFVFNRIHENPIQLIKTIELYTHNDLTVNLILRFENIIDGLKQIPDLKEVDDTVMKYKDVANMYLNYYDEETKQEVYRLFKEDFIEYGYQ